jgi:hypothetical protein
MRTLESYSQSPPGMILPSIIKSPGFMPAAQLPKILGVRDHHGRRFARVHVYFRIRRGIALIRGNDLADRAGVWVTLEVHLFFFGELLVIKGV